MVTWIRDNLGIASRHEHISEDVDVVDVTDIVEARGNNKNLLRSKIVRGAKLLEGNRKVILQCDKGIVRSGSIAIGILVETGIDRADAISLVGTKVGMNRLNLDLIFDVLDAVKSS